MSIRLYRTEDLELIQELHKTIFPTDSKFVGEELEDSEWWVARFKGEEIGFCGMQVQNATPVTTKYEDGSSHTVWMTKEVYLTRAGVLKDFRGSGLQKRMIRTRLKAANRFMATRAHTYTWVGSIASMRSLGACGFKPYKFSRDYELNQTFLYFERYL